MAISFNPNANVQQGYAQQNQYAQQQYAPAPQQQQNKIPGHPHNPCNRDTGTIPIDAQWFNWLGVSCDNMAVGLGRPVSKSQLIVALLMLMSQDGNILNNAQHLVSQMEIKSKGFKKKQA